MSYETLLVDVKDAVASVTLNRPEVRNALNATLIHELEQALATLEADVHRHVHEENNILVPRVLELAR